MGEYVRRFVTITAPGLTVPVLTNTLVSVVVRLHIQEAAQLTTGPRNQENTMFLIQLINRFLCTMTCSQNLALYGHWYSRYPLPMRPHIRIRGLARISPWMTIAMNRTGTVTVFLITYAVSLKPLHTSESNMHALFWQVITYSVTEVEVANCLSILTSVVLTVLIAPPTQEWILMVLSSLTVWKARRKNATLMDL